ncbi:hypothetical protein HPG69_014838 [Diceros bicornis minor]|uniref:Uncharacterized protein n=1 Tax=Diceros bicornis minor TaxID=77932 RepID=A0A7J7EDY0_DICBM|nr:hypothetical protein HPG69_014838 [Diceros bicornis minor]
MEPVLTSGPSGQEPRVRRRVGLPGCLAQTVASSRKGQQCPLRAVPLRSSSFHIGAQKETDGIHRGERFGDAALGQLLAYSFLGTLHGMGQLVFAKDPEGLLLQKCPYCWSRSTHWAQRAPSCAGMRLQAEVRPLPGAEALRPRPPSQVAAATTPAGLCGV